MLYEPLPGSAAVILVQLGIIEEGQIEALGARTYDAECGRLSLALDDGRTVELERAMHLQSEDGYAVRIRSRAGQTISRSFIHIDRNLGVRNLHNDRMVYIDDAEYDAAPDFSALSPDELSAESPAEPPSEDFATETSIYAVEDTPAEELYTAPTEHEEAYAEPVEVELAPEVVHDSEPRPLATEPEVLQAVHEPEAVSADPEPEALHAKPEVVTAYTRSESEPYQSASEPDTFPAEPETVGTDGHAESHPKHLTAEPETLHEQPQPEIIHAVTDPEPIEAVSEPDAAHFEPETEPLRAHAEAEPEPLRAEAEAESIAVQPQPQPEAIVTQEAPNTTAPVETEFLAAPHSSAESEPELHLASEPAEEASTESSSADQPAGATPEGSLAPEPAPDTPDRIAQTATEDEAAEAMIEEPVVAEQLAAAPLTELESSPIEVPEPVIEAPESRNEVPESQDITDLIAAAPEAAAVNAAAVELAAAEPEAPEPAGATSAAPPAEESLKAQPEPEDLQPAAAFAAPPEPDPIPEPQDPRYAPLHESLAPEDAAEFEWVAQTGTIHTYEHRQTFRYIHIDAPSGLFYDQTRTPISRAAALKHALTPRLIVSAELPAAASEPATQAVAPPAASNQPSPPAAISAPAAPAIAEPELRTRSNALTNGHARAAIKPDPDPAVPEPQEAGLSLDAFTRKRGSQLERDSWRARIAEISRVLRLNRNPNSHDDN